MFELTRVTCCYCVLAPHPNSNPHPPPPSCSEFFKWFMLLRSSQYILAATELISLLFYSAILRFSWGRTVFLCVLVGFIFSGHRPVRLWSAVFIEAVTVVNMTGVWSHPVHAPTHPANSWMTRVRVLQSSWVTLTRTNGGGACTKWK